MSVTKEEAVAAYKEIRSFVESNEFQKVLNELNNVEPEDRPQFVKAVLLNPTELVTRGINIPNDLTIQRTVFQDGRPTLFCITKYLSDGITKATITFDNPNIP